MKTPAFYLTLLLSFFLFNSAHGQNSGEWKSYIDSRTDEIYEQVVEWRRHFYQNPELSNREFETAEYIAAFLESLDMEVQTGIAHTGIVGILKGGKPGPVVGLRADIDALPVPDRANVSFVSNSTGVYMGEEVPVKHACGHDTHIAMLMGTALILSERREELPGTVKFIFQPAEEGTPEGEEGGAKMMVEEGVLKNPDVEVIFGQHIDAQIPVGQIHYRPGGIMASAQSFKITVQGKQTHGSQPWAGIDPVTKAAHIIIGLNTIISRQTELTKEAAVISVGRIRAGVRSNIIPESAELIGTIRTLDTGMQEKIYRDMHRTVTNIAESIGATATLEIEEGYPITYNDPGLTEQMLPSLQSAAGESNVTLVNAITAAEDFFFFQNEVPGLYYFVGGMPAGTEPEDAAPHHTPDCYIEETGMKTGVKALGTIAIDYMMASGK